MLNSRVRLSDHLYAIEQSYLGFKDSDNLTYLLSRTLHTCLWTLYKPSSRSLDEIHLNLHLMTNLFEVSSFTPRGARFHSDEKQLEI